MCGKIRLEIIARLVLKPILICLVITISVAAAKANSGYQQTNLVSDGAVSGTITDPNMKNPWGLANLPNGPWWIANNNSGTTEIFKGDGTQLGSAIAIPPSSSTNGPNPTGVVANTTSDFTLADGNKALFIFDGEDGTITAWNTGSGSTAELKQNIGAPSVYKGLALGSVGNNNFLYATNFHNGTIDVFDSAFKPTTVSGSFSDPNIPTGFAPFGIQNFGGNLFVTYAMQKPDKHDDQSGPGNGFVDIFNTQGVMQQRLISNGALNSPWGMAMAPSNFGQFSNDLLVGNFGDGTINAFNPHTGVFLGTLKDLNGTQLSINGLWSIKFADGGLTGATNSLFFTAGFNDEADGLFGHIDAVSNNGPNAVPAPAAVWASLPMLGLIAFVTWKRGAMIGRASN
jgi:uncharacterized protein (TIGR03118 family)